MKELIKKEIGKQKQPQFKKLALAEFLQHLILQSLYKQNAFKNLTFTGGTALRLLYFSGRYSEDLDFSFTGKEILNLEKLINSLQRDLSLQDIKFEPYVKTEKTVFKAELRFPRILYEFDISPLKDQKLTIKIEIDRTPPKGGEKEILLVTFPVSYSVSVFNLSSLFGTKLHAILFRKYTKGRDYYDLAWYLGKKIKPNFKVLNNGIKQTQKNPEIITEENFKEVLVNQLNSVSFKTIKDDVERFIINQEEINLLTPEHIKSLLRNYEILCMAL